MLQFLKFIYFCITLYMFRTVFPPIIRSSSLHIQQQTYVKRMLLPAASGNEMELLITFMSQLIHREDANTVWHARVPCTAYRIQSLAISVR
jgi:hypothetical protein